MSSVLNAVEQWRRQERWQDEAAWLRIQSQLRFAEWLTTKRPGDSRWRVALDRAVNLVATSASGAAEPLVAQVEAALSPFAKAAKAHTVYSVGHAHIDMNWMWGWPETVAATLDSLRTVLTLMDEFPEFHFSQSQASVYAIVEQFDAEMLARIAARVREGRWEVTASHWVENDMNLVGAEALVRHLSQTRAYLKGIFGLSPEDVVVNWAPDTFGHAATVPSYLVQGGVRHVYLHRPGTERQPVPEAFWWQSPDGARVLVRNDQRRGYNGCIVPGSVLEALTRLHADTGLDFSMLVYGVGDHGGGPTRRDLLMLREMSAWPVFSTIRAAPSRTFFERLEREAISLPTIVGELNYEFAGCYTSQSLIKRDNRLGEARMLDTEVACAFADALGVGGAGTARQFDENWRRVLFSHFHDILPGSGVRDTRMYCHGQFQETMAFTSVTTTRALRAVADVVDTTRLCGGVETLPQRPAMFDADGVGSGAGIAAVEGRPSQAHAHGLSPVRPFVVFNTVAVERTETVEFVLWDRDLPSTADEFLDRCFVAVAADGTVASAQRTSKGREWGHAFQRYAVPVTVPSLGYTTVAFRAVPSSPARPTGGARLLAVKHHCPYARTERPALGLENECLRVVMDPHTGRLSSVYDKATECELLDGTTGLGLDFAVERPGGMTAWVIEHAGPAVVATLVAVREVAEGPHTAALEASYKVGSSAVRLTFRLDAGEARLRVTFAGEWMERGSAELGVPNLRLTIPTVLLAPTATYEIPFGSVERVARPDQEVPALRWALLDSASHPTALLAINDCKHGHAVDGGTLRINLIRSSYDPDRMPELGEHRAEFALVAVPRGVCHAQATAMAQAFTQPLLAVGTAEHAGRLEPENSLVEAVGDGIVVSSLKRCDEGEGVVVRLHNTLDRVAEACIVFNCVLGSPERAEAVDLLERATAAGPVRIQGASVRMTVPARGIASCKVLLAASSV